MKRDPELEGIAHLLALFCIPAWLKTTVTANAPYNDAMLRNYLQKEEQVDDILAATPLPC